MNTNSQGLTIGENQSVRNFKVISTKLFQLAKQIYLLYLILFKP